MAALYWILGIAASADDPCRDTWECRDRGVCVNVHGRCAAAHDADCRRSLACKEEGRCFAREGRCAAAKDLDCRRSLACRKERRCAARGGECVDLRSCDVRWPEAQEGPDGRRCRDDPCAPGECTRNACLASPRCRDLGRCSPAGPQRVGQNMLARAGAGAEAPGMPVACCR